MIICCHIPFDETLFHDGIDFGAPCGTNVFNVVDGYVAAIYDGQSMCSNGLEIIGKDNLRFKYCHFSKLNPNLSPGTKLKKGDYIGSVDTTGFSTGCHLHLATYGNKQVADFRLIVDCEKPFKER